jgi:hypothetical protein
MNTTEQKLVKVIDEFIVFMLTENNRKKYIYSKLNELDDDELEEWTNEHLIQYLANGCPYNYHRDWEGEYLITDWYEGDYDELFTCCFEMNEIQKKIWNKYQEYGDQVIIERLFMVEEILTYYCYMYLKEMSPNDLKEYIINLIDPPFEPK